jgi:tetratricopeptide (TPR) repeat protein
MNRTQKPIPYRPRTTFQLSLPVLGISIVAVLVLGTALYFWHGHARERVADAFLQRARETLKEADSLEAQAAEKRASGSYAESGKLRSESRQKKLAAASQLWQYLQIQPDDLAASTELALAYAELPVNDRNTVRALELFRRAIAEADSKSGWTLRIRLAEMLNESGEFQEAETEGRAIVLAARTSSDIPPELNARGWSALAISLANRIALDGLKQVEPTLGELGQESGTPFVKSRELNPDDWRLAFALAQLYRSRDGDAVLTTSQREQLAASGQTLVQFADELALNTARKNPDDHGARLAAWLYRQQHELADNGEDILAAARLEPDNGVTLALAGIWHLEQIPAETRQAASSSAEFTMSDSDLNHLSEAEKLLTSAMEFGCGPEAWSAMADIRQLQKKPDEAGEFLKQGVALSPVPDSFLHQRLIVFSINSDQLDAARQQLDEWKQKTAALSRSNQADARMLGEASRIQDMLAGLIELRLKNIDEAIACFDRVIVADGRRGDRVVRIYRLLGSAFSEAGSTSRAAHYFEKAAELAPEDTELWRMAAAMRSAAGQPDQARNHFEKIVNLQPSADDWFAYASLLYQVQVERPQEDRQWLVVENALNRAEQAATAAGSSDNPGGNWLRSAMQLEMSPGEWTPPESLTGDEPMAFVGQVVRWYAEAGETSRVEELTAKYVAGRESPLERVQARVQVLFSQNQLDEAVAAVEAAIPEFQNPDEIQNLRILLMQLEFSRGDVEKAWQAMDKLARDFPDSPRLVFLLANAAISLDRISPEPAWWEEKLSKAEGPNGPLMTYISAARKLAFAAQSSDDRVARTGLEQAESAIRDAMTAQSDWPDAHSLLGRIADEQLRRALVREDQATASQFRPLALRSYQRAVELGDRSARTLLRLSDLSDSPEEATRVLRLLNDEAITRFDPLLSRMVGLNLETGNVESAEQIARSATEQRPNDVNTWLSLARVYNRQGRASEADQAAARAGELVSADSATRESLMALFQYHLVSSLQAGDAARRESELARARKLVDRLVEMEPEATRTFARGVLLDSIGDDEASQWYLSYEDSRPTQVEHLQVMLDFFRRRNVPGIRSEDVAIRLADRLVELRPDSIPLRTQRASLLMARGRPEDWEEARKQLMSMEQFAPDTTAGRRAEAILLWERREVPPGIRIDNLTRAAELLKSVSGTADALADDHILLGKICREWSELVPADDSAKKEDLRTQAVESLARASQFGSLDANQLLDLATVLIELENWQLAEQTMRQLEGLLQTETVPNPAALALQVTLWSRRGESGVAERAQPLLLEFIEQFDKKATRLDDLQKARTSVQVATIWESIGDRTEALKWFGKAAALNPENLTSLVFALVRDGQKQVAVDVCYQAFLAKPAVDQVLLLAHILNTGRTPSEVYEAAEPFMEQARQRFSNDLVVIGNLANIRSCQPEQVLAAVELYQAGLAIAPDQFVMLNNLATLYGEIPEKRDEALELINRAIALRGDIPGLLNTKARILANQGKLEPARQLLASIVHRQSDPRFWWQLAEVEWQIHEQQKSEEHRQASLNAWREALRNGIESTALTPEEVQRLETLRSQLETEMP